MKILLVNGPNLDMLGVREPAVYGSNTLADLEKLVVDYGASKGVSVECYQSNHEGCLIDKIHEAHTAYDGIVYNPGAHTHYSYALRDAVGGIDTPCVEVHISNVDAREAFRHISVIAPACVAQVRDVGSKAIATPSISCLRVRASGLGKGSKSAILRVKLSPRR